MAIYSEVQEDQLLMLQLSAAQLRQFGWCITVLSTAVRVETQASFCSSNTSEGITADRCAFDLL